MLDVAGFSVATGFVLGAGLSAFVVFVLAADFSEPVTLAVVDGFGFDEALPFDAVTPLLAGAVLVVDDVFVFAAGADTVAESSADLGAVSGFTAGAHALAMTIAISGIRA